MKVKFLMRLSGLARLGFCVWAFLNAQPLFSAEAAETKAKSALDASQPQPYMRVDRSDENVVSLRIAARKFILPKAEGTAIWLVGVSHIGEAGYYQTLQKKLNEQDIVLFEGVGYEAMRRRTSVERGGIAEEADEAASLQSTLAQSLGLAFQLDAIDYDRPGFRNSDMSIEELRRALSGRNLETGRAEGDGASAEFAALIRAMDGSSWMGKILQMGLKVLGASSKLQAMSRLMLVEILGEIGGDLSRVQGMPPNIQKMLRVLIQSRNEKVMNDLRNALAENPRPSSIAIFYGAAHMDDFERRLKSELGYQPGEEKWYSAMSVDFEKSGLSSLETMMVRSIVQFQMNMLREQMPDAKE